MRSRFDQQLELLKSETIKMFSITEEMLHQINDCIACADEDTKYPFGEEESQVFQMGKGIEKMCMDMLIRQQPVAKDLRRISSSFRLVYDSRRIATQVIDIKDTLDFMDEVDLVFETSVLKIGQKAEAQLKTAVDCLTLEQADIAKEVNDDEIDDLFQEIKTELIEKMKANPDRGGDYANLLMIAKHYEKIGDHSENIAYNSYFALTGEEFEEK